MEEENQENDSVPESRGSSFLHEYICKSEIMRILHNEELNRTRKTYNILMYTSIAFGPIAALLNTIHSAYYPSSESVFSISSKILTTMSGILVASIKFGNHEEIMLKHKQAYDKYTEFKDNKIVQKDVDDTQIIRLFDEISEESPMISKGVYIDMIKKNTDPILKDIYIPKLFIIDEKKILQKKKQEIMKDDINSDTDSSSCKTTIEEERIDNILN